MTNQPEALARCIRRGDYEAANDLLEQIMGKAGETFASFMAAEISAAKISRKQLAQKANLSCDYLYKLLRGDKRTRERDYILAICIAMSFSLPKTQYALSLYSFPELSELDKRSYLIKLGLESKISLDEMNELLLTCGCPALRTSPQMPSADFGPMRSTFLSAPIVYSQSDRGNPSDLIYIGVITKMKEKNRIVQIEQYGPLPLDIYIYAEIELSDENSSLFVHACFKPGPEAKSHFAVDRNSIFNPGYETSEHTVEWFETLIDARNSEYLELYLILDKMADKKMAEYLTELNDTRNYTFRSNCKLNNEHYELYAEYFNELLPERNEYLQIRKREDNIIFSASHHSYFLRMELDSLYEIEYGPSKKPEYLFEVRSLNALHNYQYLKPCFEYMLNKLYQQNPFLWHSGASSCKEITHTENFSEDEFILVSELCNRYPSTSLTRTEMMQHLCIARIITNDTDTIISEILDRLLPKLKSMSDEEWNHEKLIIMKSNGGF